MAHRLSTIRDADKILFLGSDGSIAEQGTWQELIDKNGDFASFVAFQQIGADTSVAPASPQQAGKKGPGGRGARKASAGAQSPAPVPATPRAATDAAAAGVPVGPGGHLTPKPAPTRAAAAAGGVGGDGGGVGGDATPPKSVLRRGSGARNTSNFVAGLAWSEVQRSILDGSLKMLLDPEDPVVEMIARDVSAELAPAQAMATAAEEAIEALHQLARNAGVSEATSAVLATACEEVRTSCILRDIAVNPVATAQLHASLEFTGRAAGRGVAAESQGGSVCGPLQSPLCLVGDGGGEEGGLP